jgi:hypothetical protein
MGNLIQVCCLSKRTNHRVCILFLSTLYIINVSLVAGPFQLEELGIMHLFQGQTLCKLFSSFAYSINVSEVFILTVVTIDRYWKICKPLDKQMTEQQTLIVCGACVLLSLVFATPLLEFQGDAIEHYEEYNMTVTRCHTSDAYSDSITHKI